jgi:hypothetical protein
MRIGDVRRKIAADIRARYHATMKKSTFKLVIRRETLRVLAGMELARVAGGGNQDAQLLDSEGPATGCVKAQLLDTGGPATGCVNVKL